MQISRFEIHITVNCVNCFQNSSNVENYHLNVRCQCYAQHDEKKIKYVWTLKAVYDKACENGAILQVTAAL